MDSRRDFLTTLGVGVFGTALLHGQGQGQAPTPAPPPARQGSQFLGEGGRTAAPPPPVRKVKTTQLFKSPEGYPNGIAVAPEGLWIAEQQTDHAVLVDWNGKLLKTVPTEAKNSSGIGWGDGCVWMAGNRGGAEGIFQTDLNGKTVSHRQIPLGPPDNGGGCHGAAYVDGKVYIAALRLRGILRVDAKTWQPELLIPYSVQRAHGIAYNPADNSVWMVSGTGDTSQTAASMGLTQYDVATGRVLSTAAFATTDCDPHGLAWYKGQLYSCDAGIHPGWPDDISPTHGYIFRIDFV
jgi:hypothetical protein